MQLPNNKKKHTFLSFVCQWSKNKMATILFCFPMVLTIEKPNFG